MKGILAVTLSLSYVVVGHGGSSSNEKPEGLSWQKWHMLEEHGVDLFDADSFFKLHDLKSRNEWETEDILSLYGLSRENVVGDGSGMGEHVHETETVSQEAKDHVVNTILSLVDADKDGKISIDEWREYSKSGKELPDFGYGSGHHMDFEMEYEEHHWNKYHAKDDPDVLIKHKEDIEHELLHHDHEIEASHDDQPSIRQVAQKYLSKVKIENIPPKYRN